MSGGGAGSGGSGSGSSGGAPTGGGRGSGGYPPPGGSGRAPRQQPPSQGERPISFQSEDRYWTDYLRVILPVVGLLLLLGLFWYWASSLIGDDNENPAATPSQAAIVLTEAAPSPTPTQEAAITPEETSQSGQPAQETTTAGDGGNAQAGSQETAAAEQTTAADATQGKFADGDIVVVNDNDVNLRSEPTTSSDVVEVMAQGTELRITGASEQAEDLTWWPVEDEATGNVGWVAESLIDPS